jgi:hypothetical protein
MEEIGIYIIGLLIGASVTIRLIQYFILDKLKENENRYKKALETIINNEPRSVGGDCELFYETWISDIINTAKKGLNHK